MRQNKERLSKVIDELLTYLFSIGATDLTIKIQERKNDFKIHIQSNYSQAEKDKIEHLIKALHFPKQEEMEEYYWNLTGTSNVGTELFLIGMMIDEAQVNVRDTRLEIELYRHK